MKLSGKPSFLIKVERRNGHGSRSTSCWAVVVSKHTSRSMLRTSMHFFDNKVATDNAPATVYIYQLFIPRFRGELLNGGKGRHRPILSYIGSRNSGHQTGSNHILGCVIGMADEFQRLLLRFRERPVQWRQCLNSKMYRKYKYGGYQPGSNYISGCGTWRAVRSTMYCSNLNKTNQ